ncbi:MAG: hypothetical protein JXB46_05455 [Candidatus Eisenbacteria bacterium]|nr:hypothetical protein [Candidatus Eisenbacteria bacterium]
MMEVLQDAYSSSTLNSGAWGSQSGYLLMRTSPATQMQSDFGGGFEGYPTFPLIDLQTMQVVNSDCWYAASWQACINAHLN